MRGRILGIGGIFFKSTAEGTTLRDWYRDKLGIDNGQHGAMFHWRAADKPESEHMTIWSIFPKDSKYYDKPFMINYIVEDLDGLLERLAAEGVSIDPKRQDADYGRFAWIYDSDGNKIELWEPPAPASLESSSLKND
jgi:catechol 2,3-dioxygenase-like lactoylglutathione lyase family enzyme